MHDAPGERRRHAQGVEIRIDRMARHQAVDPVRDRGVEGRQMRRSSSRPMPSRSSAGLQVGVERRVALAGEVLGTRRDAALLHALDPGETVASHQGGIHAVRPDPESVRAVAIRGARRGRRAEIQVHSQSAQLTSFEHALAVRETLPRPPSPPRGLSERSSSPGRASRCGRPRDRWRRAGGGRARTRDLSGAACAARAISKFRRYRMSLAARVSRKSLTSVSVSFGPARPNTSRSPTRLSRSITERL